MKPANQTKKDKRMKTTMIYTRETYFLKNKAYVDPQYTKYTTRGMEPGVLNPCHGPLRDP